MAVSISLKAVAVLGLMRFGCVYSAGNSTSQGMDDEEDGNTTRRMTPVSCPSTHPYAYYTNNAYCCKTNKEKDYAPQGDACDGSSMHAGGKTSLCCEGNQHTPCPGASCRNFYQAPTSCPSTHPYAYHTNNAYCCKTNKEKVHTPQGEACDGSSMHAGGKTSLCCEGDHYTPCLGTSCNNFDHTTYEWKTGDTGIVSAHSAIRYVVVWDLTGIQSEFSSFTSLAEAVIFIGRGHSHVRASDNGPMLNDGGRRLSAARNDNDRDTDNDKIYNNHKGYDDAGLPILV